MLPGSKRQRVIALSALVGLVVVGVLVAVLATGDDGEEEGAGGLAGEIPPGTGFLFIGGEYVEPPYEVAVRDFEITINGQVVVSLPGQAAPATEAFPPPENPQSAIEAIDAAGSHFLELGGLTSSDPDPAVVEELRRFLLSLEAIEHVERDGAWLIATDTSGERAGLLLLAPDPATEEDLRQDLESRARAWRSLLSRGGALFIDGGASVMVPGRRVPDFIPSLLEALDLPKGERVAGLRELVRSRQIAESLADAGAPDAPLEERIPEPPRDLGSALSPPGQQFVSRALPPRVSGELPAVHGEHGDYETPTADAAYLFSPFTAEHIPLLRQTTCHGGPIVEAAERHNYTVYHFDGLASNIDEFIGSSGDAGIMWVCMHGGNSVEYFANQHEAIARQQELVDRGIVGTYVTSHPGFIGGLTGSESRILSRRWYINVRHQTLRQHWRGAGTIFHSEGCAGLNHAGVYVELGVREYIAVPRSCTPPNNGTLNREFWGRLDGTIEDGTERSVGTAFNEAFAGTPFELEGSGGGDTVLSPAVRKVEPEPGEEIAVPGIFEGRVRFDAKMERLFSLPRIIELDGCDATIIHTEWLNEYTLKFRYRANTPGDLMLSVQSEYANPEQELSLHLDGNQDPEGTDHVGPSWDNWDWSVRCVASPVTPTPTTVTAPTPEPTAISVPTFEPTATATASPTPTPTPTATPTATPTPPTDGFEVTYLGPLKMRSGTFAILTFSVFDSAGQPATGEFFATLGDPPGDPRASHGSGFIGPDGKVTIRFGDVTWPPGQTLLWYFYPDALQPIALIEITEPDLGEEE